MLTAESNVGVSLDYEAIRADTQRTLTNFLEAALKTGFIVVQSASLVKAEGRSDHFIEAKRSARKTAESVKRYVGLVRDAEIMIAIQDRLFELERLVSVL
jgi:hypothetical protein